MGSFIGKTLFWSGVVDRTFTGENMTFSQKSYHTYWSSYLYHEPVHCAIIFGLKVFNIGPVTLYP